MAVQIILKNSSVEDKRPQASQLTNGEISLNYSSAGAFLCCTDTNGDVQQVGGVKIDETAPDAPVKQTLWFKPSTLTLSVYDGDKWLPIAGGGGGGTPGGGDIIQIIGNDGIDADTVAGIVTLDVELAGGDDGLEFKSSKLSATLASATDLGSVKVGDNINVTAGKISVPKATSSTFGVVKLGDGIEIDGDGSISIDVPTTTVYRGSCDLNNPPTGQINPDPALKGDAYINSADAPAVDAGWTGITGSAKIGDLVIFDGTQWDLIPLGSGEAPVTSVNGKTGDVVLDYTDVGAASEAQGELADTALQPGDNITELNNDAGYITAAEAPVLSVNGKTGVVVLDAADVGALAPGDNVSELDNDAGYITLAELPDQEPPVIISATAPTGDDAVEGNLWFNSNDGRTYVYYKDGDSSQWVDASPDSGGAGGTVGDYWLEAGGYLSPKTGTNGVDIGGSKILLNADGTIESKSNITAGGVTGGAAEIGRITAQMPTSIPLANADAFIAKYGTTNTFSIGFDGEITITNGGVETVKIFSDGQTISKNFQAWDRSGLEKTKWNTDNYDLVLSTLNTGGNYFEGLRITGNKNLAGGDVHIGTTGSFTPSTPAISLNATDGSGKFAGTVIASIFDITNNTTAKGGRLGEFGVTAQRAVTGGSTADTVFTGYRGSTQTSSIGADGSIIAAGDIQSTSQNGGQLAGFRNHVINGNLIINQRGATSGTIAGTGFGLYQSLDRWASSNGAQWESSSAVADLPSNGIFTRSLRTTNSTSAWRQGIELPMVGRQTPFISGSQFTFSVYAQGQPTYTGLEFRPSTGADPEDTVTASSFTVVEGPDGNGFSRYAYTFTLGNLSLTSAACASLTVSYPTNSYWTGVQLEPGPVATPFEHRPIATELALCQRYYYMYTSQTNAVTFSGYCNSNTDDIPPTTPTFWSHIITFPVDMRVAPTGSNYVNNGGQNYMSIRGFRAVSATFAASNVDFYGTNTSGLIAINANLGSIGATQGATYTLEAAFSYSFDAEL